MSIQNILVHCDNSWACASRLLMAMRLAERFNATLTGYYSPHHISPIVFAEGSPVAYNTERQRIENDTEEIRSNFAQVAARSAVDATLYCDQAPMFEGLSRAAHFTDLVVIGQHNPDDAKCRANGLAAHAALTSGVPVLVLPARETPPPPEFVLGRHIAVAWNATRESARALHDSLPFLLDAEDVHVLSVDTPDANVTSVRTQLKARGVRARAHEIASRERDVDVTLLEEGAALGVDFYVLGAYGHSRLREFILGGVTRGLLLDADVPLLLSH